MAVFEVTSRITRRSLKNRSKDRLIDLILELLDENDRLRTGLGRDAGPSPTQQKTLLDQDVGD